MKANVNKLLNSHYVSIKMLAKNAKNWNGNPYRPKLQQETGPGSFSGDLHEEWINTFMQSLWTFNRPYLASNCCGTPTRTGRLAEFCSLGLITNAFIISLPLNIFLHTPQARTIYIFDILYPMWSVLQVLFLSGYKGLCCVMDPASSQWGIWPTTIGLMAWP